MYHQADIKQWKFLKNCSSSCDKCSASVITPHLLQRQVLTTTFSSKSKLKPISTMLLLGIVRNWDIAGGPGGNRFLYLSFISNIISHIYFYPKLSSTHSPYIKVQFRSTYFLLLLHLFSFPIVQDIPQSFILFHDI